MPCVNTDRNIVLFLNSDGSLLLALGYPTPQLHGDTPAGHRVRGLGHTFQGLEQRIFKVFLEGKATCRRHRTLKGLSVEI